MPLVPAKCTCCGATLTLNPARDAAVCPFCGTPFVVEKAIRHYHITADKVILQNSQQEELYQAGEVFLAHGNTEQAGKSFKELTDRHPGDARGWWGLYRVFLNARESYQAYNYWYNFSWGEPADVLRNALQLASDAERPEMLREARAMVERLREGHAAQQKVVDQYNAKCDSIRKQSEKALEESAEGRAFAQAQARHAQLKAAYERACRRVSLNPFATSGRREKAELDKHGDGPMSEAWRQYDAKRSHLQGQAETQIETVKKEMAIHEMLVNKYNHLILTHENVLRPYAKE